MDLQPLGPDSFHTEVGLVQCVSLLFRRDENQDSRSRYVVFVKDIFHVEIWHLY